MKWVMLVVALIIGFYAYKTFIMDGVATGGGRTADTPGGLASLFVEAAVAGEEAGLRELAEPAAAREAIETGMALHAMAPLSPMLWQSTKPTRGEEAVSAQITGKGKVLIVESNLHGDKYKVSRVELVDF